ncbi:uncharacterized protein FTOL_11677 [Fusarium torulosum]|uniref:Uncharacterized protein n=1 Tax=Fusarium torulosum TaxID=33205 RepID=A0AAE8MIV8_9HYPO|nr:uncharacterized protein FTOL_11677 [Fusarium torulosum]
MPSRMRYSPLYYLEFLFKILKSATQVLYVYMIESLCLPLWTELGFLPYYFLSGSSAMPLCTPCFLL